jgi:hypothetical protein
MKKSHILIFAFTLIAGLLFSAQSVSAQQTCDFNKNNADCPAGQICSFVTDKWICQSSLGNGCQSNADCGTGQTCDSTSKCVQGSSSTTTQGCTSNANCTGGQVCIGGKCQSTGSNTTGNSCTSNANCTGGQVCIANKCQAQGANSGTSNTNSGTSTPSSGTTTASPLTNPLKVSSAGDLLKNIINFVLGFVGVIAAAMIIYGGIIYMTSAGNDQRIGQAKSILTYGIVGLIISLAAGIIVQLVITAVTG